MPNVLNRSRVLAGVPGGGQFADEPQDEFHGAPLTIDVVPAVLEELDSPTWLGIDEVPADPGVMLRDPHPTGGYDQIDRYENGTTIFRRNGGMHRTDGPAFYAPVSTPFDEVGGIVWRDTVSVRYFLDDAEVFDPSDGTGVPLDLQLRSVSEDGTQYWATISGHHESTVSPDGTVRHFQDGDLHRDGGPAITRPDGTGLWYRRGTLIAPGVPAEPTIQQLTFNGVSGEAHIGANYAEKRDIRRIAAEIEKDLHAASRNGILPVGARPIVGYNVPRKEVSVRVTGIGAGYLYANGRSGTLSAEGERIKEQLTAIASSYRIAHYAVDDQHTTNFEHEIQFA